MKRPWPFLALVISAIPGFATAQTATTYVIDPAQSSVYWQVYSAGTLASLGHNHVVSAPALRGEVTVEPNLADSSLLIEMEVADLVVDDPDLRAQLGDDFASVPSENDKAGTRRNMLSERLLNGERYPLMRIRGSALSSSGDTHRLTLAVDIAGQTVELSAPVNLTVGDDRLLAEGTFQLTHADLGLRPFSALMGALKVAEEIDFKYRIDALRQ